MEYLQARRLRRRFAREATRFFETIDVFVAPEKHKPVHALTNMTGHPAITLRHGFRDDGTPRAITLWGRLYDESTLLRLGSALEQKLDLWKRRPGKMGGQAP